MMSVGAASGKTREGACLKRMFTIVVDQNKTT